MGYLSRMSWFCGHERHPRIPRILTARHRVLFAFQFPGEISTREIGKQEIELEWPEWIDTGIIVFWNSSKINSRRYPLEAGRSLPGESVPSCKCHYFGEWISRGFRLDVCNRFLSTNFIFKQQKYTLWYSNKNFSKPLSIWRIKKCPYTFFFFNEYTTWRWQSHLHSISDWMVSKAVDNSHPCFSKRGPFEQAAPSKSTQPLAELANEELLAWLSCESTSICKWHSCRIK